MLTATPTVNTTSTGSPEMLTPTSYTTFADVAKREEYDDVDLPFLVDCCDICAVFKVNVYVVMMAAS